MPSAILIQFPFDPAQARLACEPVLGVPLFLRKCLHLMAAGHRHIVIAAPLAWQRHIQTLWSKYVHTPDARLTLVTLTNDHTIGPEHLFALRGALAERFVVLHAQTAVTAAWVQEAFGPALRYGHVLRGGVVVERQPANEQLQAALQAMANGPEPLGVPRHYLHIRTATNIAPWEHELSEQIRHSDIGWFAKHLNKRISLPISRWLARRRVSPHAITAFNMVIGVCVGIAAAGQSYFSLLLAGTLFQLASIIDGCDGEVAKFTFRTSRAGQLIDTACDTLTLLALLIGLCIHDFHTMGIARTAWLGAALFSGVFTFVLTMLVYLYRYGDSWSLVAFDRLFVRPRLTGRRGLLPIALYYGKLAIKKDCFSFVFFGLAVVGLLPAVLHLGALATWLAVVGLLWISRLPVMPAHVCAHTPQSLSAKHNNMRVAGDRDSAWGGQGPAR